MKKTQMTSKYTLGELIDVVEDSGIEKEAKEEIVEVLMEYSIIIKGSI